MWVCPSIHLPFSDNILFHCMILLLVVERRNSPVFVLPSSYLVPISHSHSYPKTRPPYDSARGSEREVFKSGCDGERPFQGALSGQQMARLYKVRGKSLLSPKLTGLHSQDLPMQWHFIPGKAGEENSPFPFMVLSHFLQSMTWIAFFFFKPLIQPDL